MEGEVPERGRVLRGVVVLGPRQGAFPPRDGGDVLGELYHVGVGQHAAGVVAHQMDGLLDAEMVGDEVVDVFAQDILGEPGAIFGLGRVAGAALVEGNDAVARIS